MPLGHRGTHLEPCALVKGLAYAPRAALLLLTYARRPQSRPDGAFLPCRGGCIPDRPWPLCGSAATAGACLDIAPDLWLSQTALGLLQLAQAHTELGIASLQRAATPARGTVRAQAVLATHLARFGYADEVTAFLT